MEVPHPDPKRLPTILHGKKLYFLVYSPKSPSPSTLNHLTTTLCEPSHHALVTVEWGLNNTHWHCNFLFYHSARDAFNLRRKMSWKLPEYKVKAVTSPNNVITYMTKEGMFHQPNNGHPGD